MVRIEGRWAGGLAVEATHGPSGTTLVTDAPKDNEGEGRGFSPTDLVATALGSCVMTIIAIVARRRGIDIGGAGWSVEKHMGSEPHRHIARLPVTVRLPASIAQGDRKILERAARGCPVHRSLSERTEAPITFEYVDAA